MAETRPVCGICKRPLDAQGDDLSIDCGGDCWGCMREAEEGIPDPRPPAGTPREMVEEKVRLTKTQRDLLGMLIENGGRGRIHTGSRVLAIFGEKGDRFAYCNMVSPYFLDAYKLIEPVQSNQPGPWYGVTEAGRLAHQRGYRVYRHAKMVTAVALPTPERRTDR